MGGPVYPHSSPWDIGVERNPYQPIGRNGFEIAAAVVGWFVLAIMIAMALLSVWRLI